MHKFVRHTSPEIRETLVQTVFDHWTSIRRHNGVPFRKDIDPIALRAALPYVWIAEKCSDRREYIIRLSGEKVNDAWGKNLAQLSLREFLSDERVSLAEDRWDFVLSEGCVLHGFSPDRKGIPDTVERLIAPLSNDENQIDCILGISLHASEFPVSEDVIPAPVDSEAYYNPPIEQPRGIMAADTALSVHPDQT